MNSKAKLLLISNTYAYGGGFLSHAKDEIKSFLSGIDSLLFIPYALKDRDEYEDIARAYFKNLGISLNSIHKFEYPKKAVSEAKSIYIGGGNTFRLLKELYDLDILDDLKSAILKGVPYMGSSAGIHMVTPTMRTTNDMSIVEPPSLDAMGILNFQINPHFIDADPKSKYMVETREKRLEQYHEDNDYLVLGLREGAWVRIENSKIKLGGKHGAKVFQKGKQPKEYKADSYIKLPVE